MQLVAAPQPPPRCARCSLLPRCGALLGRPPSKQPHSTTALCCCGWRSWPRSDILSERLCFETPLCSAADGAHVARRARASAPITTPACPTHARRLRAPYLAACSEHHTRDCVQPRWLPGRAYPSKASASFACRGWAPPRARRDVFTGRRARLEGRFRAARHSRQQLEGARANCQGM